MHPLWKSDTQFRASRSDETTPRPLGQGLALGGPLLQDEDWRPFYARSNNVDAARATLAATIHEIEQANFRAQIGKPAN